MAKNSNFIGCLLLASLVALGYSELSFAQVPDASDPQNMLPDPEVLDQGPIHEAFAEPLALEQKEAEIVKKKPPEPVQEIPPDEQPEGRNVQWIPGYFKYDQERDDFIWVSGLWRDVPPGRTWVPGEWQEVEGGWQWVPGFWSDAKQELRMLPIPPDSLEAGPSSPAPGDNFLWAPGCWQWQNTGYAWQAGFWYQAQPNWVWVPNHYSYTPGGCVLVNGYWDYPPQYRGWLYAPVYWGGGYAGYGGNYFYRPRSVINTGLLLANLFVNNRYGGYYYGYHRGGGYPGWLQPWGTNYGNWGNYGHRGHGHGHHGGYDPLWAYNRWHNQKGNHPSGNQHARSFNHGIHRDSDLAGARVREGSKLVTSVNDFKKDYKNFGGKEHKVRQLSEHEVAKVRNQTKKYANFDRSRIGLDSKTAANRNGNRGANWAKLKENTTVQGHILRQGNRDSLQGKLHTQRNFDIRNRNNESLNSRNLGQGDLGTRIGGNKKSAPTFSERNPAIRSKNPLESRTPVQGSGSHLDFSKSSMYRGNVNQRYQGFRQSEGSSQTGRRELYYRGSPQQGTNQLQQFQQHSQQHSQQRSQHHAPNLRSFQGSNPRNAIPQGTIRREKSASVPNFRSQSRSFQGGKSKGQRVIPQSHAFSSQNRGSFHRGGNSGGGQRADGGGNHGGGGHRGGGGKKGR